MSTITHVDAAVIGTGQAAPALSTALAARGERVALFEGGTVGGSCVNVGCTPTKTLRKSARVAHIARRAADFGVQVGDVRVDVSAALGRMREIVERSRSGLSSWIAATSGLELVRHWAALDGRVDDRFVVRAGDRTFHARRVYLNVGTLPALPPIPGLAESQPLTNDALLALDELPRSLTILGGSYIGLELGQILARLGAAVTILEAAPAVATREDRVVSDRIASMLRDEGLTIRTGVTIHHVERAATGERIVSFAAGAESAAESVRSDALLAATGRRPNTSRLGLETIGLATDAQGYIPVDDHLATTVPGVWALGDVNRRGAFTHTAWQDHEIVLDNHLGGTRSIAGRIATYAMYTDPPLGRIGMTEREAREEMSRGRRFLHAGIEMSHVSRAKEEGETIGLIRVLVDADTHRFVGITMLGIGADEIVQVVGAMMAAGAPYEALRDALPIHPTVTEFFPTILNRLTPLA